MTVDPLENRFKHALHARHRQIGFWCTMDGTVAVEVAGRSRIRLAAARYRAYAGLRRGHPAQAADRRRLRHGGQWCARPGNDRVRIKRLLDVDGDDG